MQPCCGSCGRLAPRWGLHPPPPSSHCQSSPASQPLLLPQGPGNPRLRGQHRELSTGGDEVEPRLPLFLLAACPPPVAGPNFSLPLWLGLHFCYKPGCVSPRASCRCEIPEIREEFHSALGLHPCSHRSDGCGAP